MATVTVIPAKPMQELKGLEATAKLRVAAYCRVSTDNEEQLSSYEAQVSHYTDHIKRNPEWEFSKRLMKQRIYKIKTLVQFILSSY